MGGGSARAGFASKRWLLTWSSLTLVLPVVGQAEGRSDTAWSPPAELLPTEYFVPYGFVVFPRCPGPGCTRERWWVAGGVRNPSTKSPNKGLLESPLCTEHADYQAEFEQTRQKKELHAQMNQRLMSKIHPGQSFTSRARRRRSADPAASADAANPRLRAGSPCSPRPPAHLGFGFIKTPRAGVWTSPSAEHPPGSKGQQLQRDSCFPGRKVLWTETPWEEASCRPAPQNGQKPK